MTSQINYSAINESYPVPGQDNNSQGFRDNFAAISAGLAQAATEITALQTNGIDVTNTNGNNLQGSTLYNGFYKEFNGVFYNVPSVNSSGATIAITNGPMQQFTITATATLTIDWASVSSGMYAVVKFMLISDQRPGTYVVTLAGGSGVSNFHFKLATGWTSGPATGGNASVPTVSLTNNGKYEVIEAWTVDGGSTVFLKSIGEY
jgi:hypothetical protein